MTRRLAAVLAAAAVVAVPFGGVASARCPEDNAACQAAAQLCAIIRQTDPTGQVCPWF